MLKYSMFNVYVNINLKYYMNNFLVKKRTQNIIIIIIHFIVFRVLKQLIRDKNKYRKQKE